MTFYDDADRRLYMESCPIRITPPPPTDQGPTAQWLAAHTADVLPLPVPVFEVEVGVA